MTTYIALLRAVNLAGRNAIAMSELRALLTRLGFSDVQTLLQSGNVIFRGKAQRPGNVERLLETETAARLKLTTEYFVRTADEWKSVVARNPFREEATRDPGHLVVTLLKDAPQAGQFEALRAAITGPEIVHLDGRQAYIVFPDGIGRSKLTTALTERKLGTSGTGRNWNTVMKIAALTAVSRP
jgi:uncharacterized protein (DUF1697 family)